jgi:prophage DNA circulation protein
MYKPALQEAAAVIDACVTSVLGVIPATNNSAALCRMIAGRLSANAQLLFVEGQAGTQMAQVFDLARQAGTTVYGIRAARNAFYTAVPGTHSLEATAVYNNAIRMSLATEATIIANMDFVSVDDVDRVKATLNDEFGDAEEVAADDMEQMTFQALIKLHAAITAFLVETARPLPRIMNYRFAAVMSSLVTAQRLYCDASRADELRDENKVVHPAFCPVTGRALSS